MRKVVEDWPRTLQEWDKQEAVIPLARDASSRYNYVAPLIGPRTRPFAQSFPEPASAICFALEFGCSDILPAAFYQLYRTDPDHDWDSPKHRNSEVYRPARWSLLNRDALLRYVKGSRRLQKYCSTARSDRNIAKALDEGCRPPRFDEGLPSAVFDADPELLTKNTRCFNILLLSFDRIFDKHDDFAKRDPLKLLEECLAYSRVPAVARLHQQGLCHMCESHIGTWVARNRQDLWERLPRYFSL